MEGALDKKRAGCCLPKVLSFNCKFFLFPPCLTAFPNWDEGVGPDAAFCGLGFGIFGYVILGVAAVAEAAFPALEGIEIAVNSKLIHHPLDQLHNPSALTLAHGE